MVDALARQAEELSRSNRDLEEFAYVASHDLQEPLRKILSFGDRLKAICGDALTDRGKDYLERMQDAAARTQTLINDLLSFSRLSTKGQPFVPVRLSRLVEDAMDTLEIRIEQEGATVEIGGLPILEADPTQMRQLFQNLLGNALKFHRTGVSPVIKVSGKLIVDGREGQEEGRSTAGAARSPWKTTESASTRGTWTVSSPFSNASTAGANTRARASA